MYAQYNIERLISIGRSALYFDDFVLSIQYFNQAISAKPYLYEPWYLRAVAKYNLDDFHGAENDCSEAIDRNPFVVSIYELRGLCRIQQKKYAGAISDYDFALKYSPDNRNLWHNRVLCHIQQGELDQALLELDTIHARWSQYAPAYSMHADVLLQQKDTTEAIVFLKKSLDIDKYDGRTWADLSLISLQRQQWKDAEDELSQAIRLLPKNGGYYINRALARYNQNNLRGAMADYDMALDLEPNNFLGHYNRGLLRADVGDDNRAITDFDFVLQLEPDNMLALFNRAVLLDRTGDLKGAVRDYSKVIDEYPNFWTGILFRANCYRRLGQTAKAELDEFAVYKAQLYKHLYGINPKDRKRNQRKRSEIDPEKYNELVVEDEQEPAREYVSEYRGRVQNRKAELDLLPLFSFAMENSYHVSLPDMRYDSSVEEINQLHAARMLYISNAQPSLDTHRASDYFGYADSLTAVINSKQDIASTLPLLFHRAVAYYCLQDNESSINDLTTLLLVDSTSVPALWLRAVCRFRHSVFTISAGNNAELSLVGVRNDLDQALQYSPNNEYLLYNRGCVMARQQHYSEAIDEFTSAIQINPHFAEAYYNRGLCYLKEEKHSEGIADMSKAGELGLYSAYSIIKKYIHHVRN